MSIVDEIKESFKGAMEKLDARLGGMESQLKHVVTKLPGGTREYRAILKLAGIVPAGGTGFETFTVPQGEEWCLKSWVVACTAGTTFRLMEEEVRDITQINQLNLKFTQAPANTGASSTQAEIYLMEGTYTICATAAAGTAWGWNASILKRQIAPEDATTVGTDD